MSMYEMVFADGEKGLPLLGALGFKSVGEVGRYRSAWLEMGDDKKPRIAVYTRNGGGNREEYQPLIDELAKHPNYLYDKDDNFDCTYATIYFSIPENLERVLYETDNDWKNKIDGAVNMSEVWMEKINALKNSAPARSHKEGR